MVIKHPHLHEHETILEVNRLSVSYGKVEALHDISLTIRRGEIVTVIGPNGAGKTTLLAALMGLLPAAGDIVYMGHAQGREREVEHLVRHGMTLVPEKRELFAEMSVADNLCWALSTATGPATATRWKRWTRSSNYSRVSRSAVPRSPARCPAVSARCWPWAAR